MQNIVNHLSNTMQINMHNMHNMETAHQYAKYAKNYVDKNAKNFARKKMCRICFKIC